MMRAFFNNNNNDDDDDDDNNNNNNANPILKSMAAINTVQKRGSACKPQCLGL
jgi:hypothetical protein